MWWKMKLPSGVRQRCGRLVVTLVTLCTTSGMSNPGLTEG